MIAIAVNCANESLSHLVCGTCSILRLITGGDYRSHAGRLLVYPGGIGDRVVLRGGNDWFRVVNIFVPRSGTVIAIGVNSATLNDHTAVLATSVYQTLHKAGLS